MMVTTTVTTETMTMITTDPVLVAKLKESVLKAATPGERREQKISWVWGNLPKSSPLTKADVEAMLIESGQIEPRPSK